MDEDDPLADLEPGAAPGADLSPDEAQELEVDELLDEFNEFDDLDELVEDVEEDEDLEAFENMGDAGSFDDLLEDIDTDPVDEAVDVDDEAEPAADASVDSESDTDVEAAADDTGATPAADIDASGDDEQVEDASAVFEELKDEVEMVGFDELQDELDELEFDEFDSDDEVGMDELLGDEADEDDEAFLEDARSADEDFELESESEPESEPTSESDSASESVAEATGAVDEPAETSETDAVDEFDDLFEDADEPATEPAAAETDPAGTAEVDAEPVDADGSVAEPDAPEVADDGTAESESTPTETSAGIEEDGEDDGAFETSPETESDEVVDDTAAETGSDAVEPFPGVAPDAESVDGPGAAKAANGADDAETRGQAADPVDSSGDDDWVGDDESEPFLVEGDEESDEIVDFGDTGAESDDSAVVGAATADVGDDDNPDSVESEGADRIGDDVEETATTAPADDFEIDPSPDGEDLEFDSGFETDVSESVPDTETETETANADADADGIAADDPAAEFGEVDGFDEAFGDDTGNGFDGETSFETGNGFDPDVEDDGFDDGTGDLSLETSFDAEEFGNDGTAESDDQTDQAATDDGADDDHEEIGGFRFESAVESTTDETGAGDDSGPEMESAKAEPQSRSESTAEFGSESEHGSDTDTGTDTDVIDEIELDDDPTLASDVDVDVDSPSSFETDDDEFASIGSDPSEDGFETGFDDPEPDTTAAGSGSETGYRSESSSESGTGPGTEPEFERVVEEPELEIPEIAFPETPDRDGADDRDDDIQSIRVDVDRIDELRTLVEGLVTTRVRLQHAAEVGDDITEVEPELEDLAELTTDLQETVMDVRLVPLETVVNRLPRIVRDIAREQEKEVAFDLSGEGVELDRSILDRIRDPLVHLVRNAVDHGIESPEERETADKPREGSVEVTATRSRGRVTISVSDDGAGLDPDRLRTEAVEADALDESEADDLTDEEAYDLVFHPGFSTTDSVTDVSGRGVGMDVVKRTVENLDGTVDVDSEPGQGTTVTMTLPVSIAIEDVLFLEVGDTEFGVPTKVVQDVESTTSVETSDGEPVIVDGDEECRVLELADELGFEGDRELEVRSAAESGQEMETTSDDGTDIETDTGSVASAGADGVAASDDSVAGRIAGGGDDGMVVRVRDDVRPIAIHCDRVRDQKEVVVKPFEGFMGGIPGFSGATVRGRGQVVNILDVTTL
ncbi:ATP-binding protein [Halobiforma nitratireducens]|uniref:Chemotaxis protein CheA n=1 Tax=Halobiforma nitratireducens JCM 10879 TaxID=1227454 RepID=M0MC85_9EURY|nr:ATP-binding protein [Halobiforma nitratireducens]EMA42948.1 chemotaxis protein CheA [Halobiforma nitratireducens JCM 10879]